MSALDVDAATTRAWSWGRTRRRVHRVPILATTILVVLVTTAVFAPLLAPHDPTVPVPGAAIHVPPVWMDGGSWDTPLGTDFQSRDTLSRLIYGGRISLVVGLLSTLVAGVAGTFLGILAGYRGGWIDQLIMRVTDGWIAMPGLVFAIFLAAILGPGTKNVILVLGLVYWTTYARVVRSEVISLKEREFVKLAEVSGASATRVMVRHILPNVVNTAVVLATLTIGIVIIAEASMSFLGVGVPPPDPAWGSMLSDSRNSLLTGMWWLTVFPGACIAAVVLATQLFGDWLRVRLDPRMRQL
jgi:peptide/nickel transport system permease protein